jgi:uncharacterized protein (UPF0261 family)
MSKHERLYAALGSAALNVVLALVLSQSAGAAVPASGERQAEPRQQVIEITVATHGATRPCAKHIRDRAIAAVVLALML